MAAVTKHYPPLSLKEKFAATAGVFLMGPIGEIATSKLIALQTGLPSTYADNPLGFSFNPVLIGVSALFAFLPASKPNTMPKAQAITGGVGLTICIGALCAAMANDFNPANPESSPEIRYVTPGKPAQEIYCRTKGHVLTQTGPNTFICLKPKA